MSSSTTIASCDGGLPVRHALVAGLGASALVHVGLGLAALTLTPASTHSEVLAIMELAPAPEVAPAPAAPEPRETPATPTVATAAPTPRTVRKPAPRTSSTQEPAQLPAAGGPSPAEPPHEVAAPARQPAQLAAAEGPSPAEPPHEVAAPVHSMGTARSPSVLTQVDPTYPASARRDRIQGIVRVEVQLDRTGQIVALHVRKSIPLLDTAALAALRQWRFSPARDERGHAIAATVVVPVRFVLR